MSNPWMPLYWADLISDTTHLTAAEFGAYMRLLGRYWLKGESLDASPSRLRKIAGMTEDEWSSSCETLAEFFGERDGRWHHGRVEAELEKAKEKYDRLARAGREGGIAKAKARRDAGEASQSPEHVSSDATISPEQNPGDALATTTTTTSSSLRSEKVCVASAPTNPPESEKQKLKQDPRGHRLPADWKPSDDLLAWAAREHPNIDAKRENEKFCDWWHAKAGKDARKLDWDLTWKGWIRRSAERLPFSPSKPNPTSTFTAGGDDARWPLRVDAWRRNRHSWLEMWGPPPDHPGFRGPAALAVRGAA